MENIRKNELERSVALYNGCYAVVGVMNSDETEFTAHIEETASTMSRDSFYRLIPEFRKQAEKYVKSLADAGVLIK